MYGGHKIAPYPCQKYQKGCSLKRYLASGCYCFILVKRKSYAGVIRKKQRVSFMKDYPYTQ